MYDTCIQRELRGWRNGIYILLFIKITHLRGYKFNKFATFEATHPILGILVYIDKEEKRLKFLSK